MIKRVLNALDTAAFVIKWSKFPMLGIACLLLTHGWPLAFK